MKPTSVQVGIVLREHDLGAWAGRLGQLAERSVAAGIDHLTVGDHVSFAGGHGAMLVVGSVTRADMRKIPATTPRGYALIPRGIGGFTPLAQRGGYGLARSEAAPLSDQVLLVPI